MSESASQFEADGREEIEKPSSGARIVNENDEYHHVFFTNFQHEEFCESFPNLAEVMMNDLDAEGSIGGMIYSQEQWTLLESTMDLVETMALSDAEARMYFYEKTSQNIHAVHPEAPKLTEIEKTKIGIQSYLHSIDVLKYQPGDDHDAFEEDVKDRRRVNPIAKQTARRLSAVFEEAKRNFPGEFMERDIPIDPETPQVYPTNMLPPANPELRDELLTKLGTILKEQK